MATDIQIANLAITRLGHDADVASFNASGTKSERWFASNYDFIKQALLREHGWKFAIKRAIPTADSIRTITGATQASPVVITSAAHGFTNGQVIYIANVLGMTELNNRTFTVANAAANTFELSGEDGTSHTAYSSGGSAYGYVATEFTYRFPIPADCLRLMRVGLHEIIEYRVEGGYIYTNESAINIEYISDADEALFDSQFVDLFASRLSAEISFYLTDNSTLTEQSWTLYNGKLSMSRTMDSRQGTPRGILSDDPWLLSRF
jgi:hypothetical protein